VTGSVTSLNPAGTVTFRLCGPFTSQPTTTGCSSSDSTNVAAGTGTLSNPNPATGISTATSSPAVNTGTGSLTPGWYCFEATWPGDTNYIGSKDATSATNECFHVAKINTQTVTQTNDGSGTNKSTITLGGSISDTATVTGTSVGGDPTGNVEFFICTQATSCSTGGTSLGTVGLTPDGVASTFTSTATKAYQPSATGSYCFRAEYGGSTVYNTSTDNGANECFTVTDSTSEASTQSWVPNDSATVTAAHGSPLSGELKIQLYSGTGCVAANADATHVYTKTLTNATSAADRTLTTSNGDVFNSSVSWLVTFTSTNSNVDTSGATTHCESSTLTVNN
jgi:hypothetical protein